MDETIIYRKTVKGTAEVADRKHGLGKDLRRVLILVDGRRDIAELSALTRAGEMESVLSQLEAEGYIEPNDWHEVDPQRVAYVPAANDPQVFSAIKQKALDEITERIGPVGNPLITEIESCADALELRAKLRNIEAVLVRLLGPEDGTALARKIGAELTWLVPRSK